MMTQRTFVSALSMLAVAVSLVGSSLVASAAPPKPTLVALARWTKDAAGKDIVEIPVGAMLTTKQQNVLNSGFTSVSQVSLLAPVSRDDRTPVEFSRVGCSVRYDTWEERYDVVVMETTPKPLTIKSYDEFSQTCLTGHIIDGADVLKLAPSGGSLFVDLKVQQISPEQSEKIKKHLIRQQSALMQGLFAHMIGEINVNETIRIQVRVPPRGETVQSTPSPPAAPAPGDRKG